MVPARDNLIPAGFCLELAPKIPSLNWTYLGIVGEDSSAKRPNLHFSHIRLSWNELEVGPGLHLARVGVSSLSFTCRNFMII